ncbi:MAG: sodium:solute symporter family protein [bacterium]|nr:sodium:solute symporter family protein [bacterium]
MSFGTVGVIALGVYLVGLVVVAEFARRAKVDASPSDHFLAGRGLGTFVLFLTLYATAYSGNSLLGYPGEAYRRGFSWIMATGFMMSIIVMFHVLAPKLRPLAVRHGFVTPGDWIRHRFGGEPWGRALLAAIAVLMAIALGNFLVAQLVAMGHVTSEVTGGLIPFPVGVLGLAALILLYETLGGMRAVAWTDTAQGLLMGGGLLALLFWLVGEAGGLAAVSEAIAEIRPDAIRVPDVTEQANWASTIVLLGTASVVYPQAIQRVFAAKSGAALKRAFSWMTFMPLTTTLVVTLIGLAAIPRLGGLGEIQADTVMPRLLASWAELGPTQVALAVLVFLGALAAIMSTADSVLLSLGSVVAVDLMGGDRNRAETTVLAKRVTVVAMVLATGVALFPRLTLWSLIELKMELLIQAVPAFLIALHWRRLSARAVLLGVALGTLVAVGASLFIARRIGGVHVGVIGLLVNTAVVLLVTALRR